MRRFSIALALLAACAADPAQEEADKKAAVRALIDAPPDGPSAARDHGDLDRYSGQEITLVGMFTHLNQLHGVLTLASGLRVYLPHFDQWARGNDWHKYLGQRCVVTGTVHTYTKNIDGYRGPFLVNLSEFVGPDGE